MKPTTDAASAAIRDRVRELRRVPARDLVPDPRNWRTHPEKQTAAMTGILAEIGYANALLARELDDGRLMLIDGHLRASTTPDEVVPVLILDVDEVEAAKLLLTLDPIGGMAGSSPENLDALLREVNTGSDALQELYADLAKDAGLYADEKDAADAESAFNYAATFAVTVVCRDEAHQREVYERLVDEGLECKVVVV